MYVRSTETPPSSSRPTQAAPHRARKQYHNTSHTHTRITRTHGHPWARYHVVGIQLCAFAYLEVAPKPYNRPKPRRCNAAKIASHQEPGSRGRVLDGRQSLGATPTVLANAKRRKEVGLRHPPCGLRTRQTRVNAVFSRTARRQPAQTSIAACIQRLEGHGHVALPLVVDDGQIPRA